MTNGKRQDAEKTVEEIQVEAIKEVRAATERLLADPEVKAAVAREVLEKATKHFKRP
jgi:hypothetical protein